MIVYLWDAEGGSGGSHGITGRQHEAVSTVAAILRSGQASAARVEMAVSVPAQIGYNYERAGKGWTARAVAGRIEWQPVG